MSCYKIVILILIIAGIGIGIYQYNKKNDASGKARHALAQFLQVPDSKISCSLLTGGFDEGTVMRCQHAGTDYVIKSFPNKAACHYEAAWTKLASDLGMGPKFYYQDPEDAYFIMAYVPGHSLVPETSKDLAVLATLAAHVKLLHQSIAPQGMVPSQLADRITTKYKNLTLSGPLKELVDSCYKATQKLQQKFAAIQVPLTPCHNDLNPRNIFIHDGKVTIIDWGDALVGNPYYDAAIFIVLNAIPEQEERFFLEQYHAQLLTPPLQDYFRALKQMLRLEFALNCLRGVAENKKELLAAAELPEVQPLSYYLAIFAEQEIKDISPFAYTMALGALKDFTYYSY